MMQSAEENRFFRMLETASQLFLSVIMVCSHIVFIGRVFRYVILLRGGDEHKCYWIYFLAQFKFWRKKNKYGGILAIWNLTRLRAWQRNENLTLDQISLPKYPIYNKTCLCECLLLVYHYSCTVWLANWFDFRWHWLEGKTNQKNK